MCNNPTVGHYWYSTELTVNPLQYKHAYSSISNHTKY